MMLLLNISSFFLVSFGGFSIFHFFAIISLLGVLGIPASIAPIAELPETVLSRDYLLMIALSIALFFVAFGFNGVQKAYAIQAGRELRVIVESEKVNDDQAAELSFNISQKIQTDMTYPGQVKVTVIRETRAVNIAT